MRVIPSQLLPKPEYMLNTVFNFVQFVQFVADN